MVCMVRIQDIAQRKSLVPKVLQLIRFPFLSAEAQLRLRNETILEYLPTKNALALMAECSVEFANSAQRLWVHVV